MISSDSLCFIEDAACVIVRESSWRRHIPMGGESLTESGDKEGAVDQLLFFLGRALSITRHTLYVLLCVDNQGGRSPQASSALGHHNGGCDLPPCDAAEFVSCGPEAWNFCVWLSTKLENLTSQLELTASPIILPWETSKLVTSGPVNEAASDCTHWVLRARAAVIRHYLLTIQEPLSLQPTDETSLACAVPLVLDSCFAFTCREICDLWPRHCHLSVQHAIGSASKAGRPNECSREAGDNSTIQVSPVVNEATFRGGEGSDISGSRSLFRYTVVGGTFDRLHAGHKLLLAAAALATSEAVGLAVAAGQLVNRKSNSPNSVAAADIEPFSYRLQVATAFLELVAAARCRNLFVSGFSDALREETNLPVVWQCQAARKGYCQTVRASVECSPVHSLSVRMQQSPGSWLQLQVYRLTDAIGPADRLAFDCLVVSAESISGARAVNTARMQLGNEPVSLLIVELVPKDAVGISKVAEVLEATLPHTLGRTCDNSEVDSRSSSRRREDERIAPAKKADQGEAAVLDKELRVPSAARKNTLVSPPTVAKASHGKVSSTELRHQQWVRLHCDLVSWLCKRLQEAWLWLVGSNSELEEAARQSASLFWRLLCAEHAAPWRRLHTFERVAQTLKRLDDEQLSVRPDPVVLCVFLGSLLACPCRCITLSMGPCDATDCSLRNSTVATWTPDAEREVWQRAAECVVTGLQSSFPRFPSDQQGVKSAQTQWSMGELQEPTATCGNDSLALKGRYSLLMDLVYEQRIASLATLASPPRPDGWVHGSHPTCTSGNTEPDAQEAAELARIVRRLEQSNYTEGSETLATNTRKLRQEYFFLEEAYFTSCRISQLTGMLKEASDELGSLGQQEHLRAIASIKQELEILRRSTK